MISKGLKRICGESFVVAESQEASRMTLNSEAANRIATSYLQNDYLPRETLKRCTQITLVEIEMCQRNPFWLEGFIIRGTLVVAIQDDDQ